MTAAEEQVFDIRTHVVCDCCFCGVKRRPDGKHEASYEGRGVHRDVYRMGDIIMKLSTDVKETQIGSNRLEAEALKKKQKIFVRLYVCFLKATAL